MQLEGRIFAVCDRSCHCNSHRLLQRLHDHGVTIQYIVNLKRARHSTCAQSPQTQTRSNKMEEQPTSSQMTVGGEQEPGKQTQDEETITGLRGGCGLWECLAYVHVDDQNTDGSAALCCFTCEECCCWCL